MMEDLTNLGNLIVQEHEGKWVAFTVDYKSVVSFSESLIDLKKKIGDQEVIYMKVPPADAYLTF